MEELPARVYCHKWAAKSAPTASRVISFWRRQFEAPTIKKFGVGI